VAVAGLSLAITLTCTFNALLWINRPFPGFFVWPNLYVPPVGGPNWTGYDAQVPYEWRLISADDEPIETAKDVYALVRSEGPEEDLTYAFESPDSGTVEITVRTMRLRVVDFLWSLGSYLAIGSLLTLLGFAVYLIRPDRPGARAMLVASVIWGLYLVTSADMIGPAWFQPLYLMLRAIAPAALVHLALSFPVQRRILDRRWVLPAVYFCAAGLGVADTLTFEREFGIFIALNDVHAAAMMVGGAVLIGLLVHGLLFPPSAAARQRTKIAALGGVLAFLSPVAGYFISSVMGVSIPFNFLAIPLAIFPVAIGWAIVKDDLFEVDAIIRHAVAWAILTGLIAATYLGTVGLLEVWFAGRSSRVAQLFFLLALVAALNPLRNQVQAALDYLFARDVYDYRKIVDEASQALATMLDLDAVVERVLNTITGTTHVEFGAVWLRAEGGGYRLQAQAGHAAASLPKELEGGSPLLRRVARKPQHILGEEALVGRDEPPADQLLRLGTRLLVPMTFERRVVGLIALGAKRSGRFFSGEDLALMRTLANQGAVAVQNARSVHTLKRVNQELRDAQSRLIEAERFAAIGELSALVAHGIRNPLAGIKAAAQYAELDLPSDHPLHENIADIITEVDKLEGRIKALLDFARPFEPHPAPCDVAQIVRDALASLRNQISAHGINVVTDFDPELPQAHLDFAQIEQVLLALMSNAIEAMPRGGRLAVSTQRTDGGRRLRITVADTGAGIHPTQLPHLFDLFVTGKPSGTGLGLAFAKKIVELHGGRIAATSELALGSQFIIELPIVAPAARDELAPRRARSA